MILSSSSILQKIQMAERIGQYSSLSAYRRNMENLQGSLVQVPCRKARAAKVHDVGREGKAPHFICLLGSLFSPFHTQVLCVCVVFFPFRPGLVPSSTRVCCLRTLKTFASLRDGFTTSSLRKLLGILIF